MLIHAEREHVVAPPRSLNERQTASFGHLSLCRFFTAAVWCVPALRVPLVHSLINHFRQKTQRVTGRPFAPGCGLLYSIDVIGVPARTSSMPRECLPVQVES